VRGVRRCGTEPTILFLVRTGPRLHLRVRTNGISGKVKKEIPPVTPHCQSICRPRHRNVTGYDGTTLAVFSYIYFFCQLNTPRFPKQHPLPIGAFCYSVNRIPLVPQITPPSRLRIPQSRQPIPPRFPDQPRSQPPSTRFTRERRRRRGRDTRS